MGDTSTSHGEKSSVSIHYNIDSIVNLNRVAESYIVDDTYGESDRYQSHRMMCSTFNVEEMNNNNNTLVSVHNNKNGIIKKDRRHIEREYRADSPLIMLFLCRYHNHHCHNK
jgi:hypothetical protein